MKRNAIILSKNENFNYAIYCNCDNEALLRAAEELKGYLAKILGVDIEIDCDENKSNAIKLVIDDSCDEKLGEDGFIILVESPNIMIKGRTGRAVLFGVYEFLERFLGVRFLTFDYTHFESIDRVEIVDCMIEEIPDFDIRCFLSAKLSNTPEFSSHMRMNNEWLRMPAKLGGKMGMHPSGHNVFKLLPPAEYAEKHPDWYYIKDGKVKDLCYSHMGILTNGLLDESLTEHPVKIAANNFYKMLIDPQNADYKYFNISQQDSFSILDKCNCDDCLTGNEYFARSGMLIRFINAISDCVNAKLKDNNIQREYYIVTLSYMWSENPPWDYANNRPLHSTVVPRENVYIRLAPINEKHYFNKLEDRQISSVRNMFTFWQKITRNIMIWDYEIDYAGYLLYYPTMHNWKADFSLMKSMNAKYVMLQSAHTEPKIWQDDIKAYVASKMLWNIGLNYEDLQDEFISLYYKDAAKYIKQFIANMDKKFNVFLGKDVGAIECISTRIGGSLIKSSLYSALFWEEQLALLQKAIYAINNSDLSDNEKSRIVLAIKSVILTPLYMIISKYDEYYSDGVEGKRKMVLEFFNTASEVGISRYIEGKTIEHLRETFADIL